MSSFKGSYIYAVDDKGRVSLPAKLRKYVSPEANDTFVVTRGFEQCLFVYPVDEWNKLEQNLRSLSSYNPEHRRFVRTLLELASESQLDGQARLSIPQELRDYANISGEVRVIGTLDKIELWDPQTYDKYKNNQADSYENIAAKVMR
jgi:MraZ protein